MKKKMVALIKWHIRFIRRKLDTNGDGIGDLREYLKLDSLKELGIDIIWLSRFSNLLFVDQGYDISDYCTRSRRNSER